MPTTGDTTVAAWVKTWLSRRVSAVKPKTYSSEASVLRRWVIPSVGTRRLAALGPQDVRAITGAMAGAGLSTTHQRYAARIFQQTLRDAVQEGYLVPTRAIEAPKPTVADSGRTSMKVPEAIKVLGVAAAKEDGSRWVIAFLQGLRQGEALGLTWDEVDLEAGVLTVRWTLQEVSKSSDGKTSIPSHYSRRKLVGQKYLLPPKTKAALRTIPLIPAAVESLRAWKKVAPASPHGLVWPTKTGQPRNAAVDREEFYALQKSAKVSNLESGRPYFLHEIRHTTVSLLLAAGVATQVIETIVGHSKLVENYVHIDADQVREALSSLGRVLKIEN